MKKETYQIWKLPTGSIDEDSEKCNRERVFYRIIGDTFPDIHQDLRIRPRAAIFARYRDNVYAVLHTVEGKTECLFLFCFEYSRFYAGMAEIQLCRCLGTTKVKRHRSFVKGMIERNLSRIQSFDSQDWLEFTFMAE